MMKKYFYFMSFMLCMIFGSMAFVSCGDDDDSSGGSSGGSGNTSITAQDLLGCWYGVDENSSEKINVFVMYFEPNDKGFYMEYKAKAKNNWAMDPASPVEFSWTLVNGTVTANISQGNEHTDTKKGDILQKIGDNKIKIRRYLTEDGSRTDIVEMTRINNPQEAEAILNKLVEEKTGNNGGNNEGPDTSITAQDLYGIWCGVDENSAERVSIFMMHFGENGEGHYLQIKAKEKEAWEVEYEEMDMQWSLDKGIMTATLITAEGKEHMIKGEILQKVSDKQLKVKRYFDENGTQSDVVDLRRIENQDELQKILTELLEDKMGK